MRNESDQLKILRQRLAATESENHRLRLKNEGLEIMIDIAENHGAARAAQSADQKKVWQRRLTATNGKSAELPAPPGWHSVFV